MTAVTRLSRKRHVVPFALTALCAALAACLVVEQARLWDSEAFARLLVAFGATDEQLKALAPAASWISLSGLLNTLGFGLFAGTALLACFKLDQRAGVVLVLIQLVVLGLLYQWLLWSWLKLSSHPLGFLTAVLVGAAAGMAFRMQEEQHRLRQTQYYELMLRNRELQETRLALIKQDEVERRMLAADLHDQVLNDLKQVVSRFESYVQEPDPDNAQKIRVLTEQVMREIREVMDSLCPSVLEHLGLGAAIEDALRKGSERSGFKVRFRNKIDPDDLAGLSLIEQSLLYRLVQESITNICKHAEAATVRATMEKDDDGTLVVRITDDGKGLDPAKARADSRGLRYMRLRAELIGATISWMPGDKGKGTAVEIRIMLDKGKQQTPDGLGQPADLVNQA